MNILPNNRVQQYIEENEAMLILEPCQDFMMLKKHEKKSDIVLPQGIKQDMNTIAFEILSIGPGRWELGKFIATTHQVGDMVFIVGNVAELHYQKVIYVMAREKDIIAKVKK